jgi:hypothetical protein
LQKLKCYPLEYSEVKIPESFNNKCILLQKLDFELDCKEKFISNCFQLNDLRNKLAHSFIRDNRENLVYKMNNTKRKYHKIKEIYISNSIKIYNFIHGKTDEYRNYINENELYSEDIVEIGNIIKNRWSSFYYEDFEIYITLYAFLYNRKNPDNFLDANNILSGIYANDLTKENITRFLEIA